MDKKKMEAQKNLFPNPNKGVEVKEGQNFASLSQAERDAYFRAHENRWKTRYNANRGTVGVQQNFSRG